MVVWRVRTAVATARFEFDVGKVQDVALWPGRLMRVRQRLFEWLGPTTAAPARPKRWLGGGEAKTLALQPAGARVRARRRKKRWPFSRYARAWIMPGKAMAWRWHGRREHDGSVPVQRVKGTPRANGLARATPKV